VLLMLAEAENELTGPATALPFINQVRARPSVNMPAYPTAQFPTATKDQMFRAIMHERRVELSGEQIRNRDIRRWRKANKFGTAEPITNFEKNKHELLPLPFVEIDNNEALTNNDQNPGY
jgi:starch-binding outer membrane protein, SusD/RagB family